MKYLLSMDGGGSKTKFLLANEEGIPIDTLLTDGCSVPQIGIESACGKIIENIRLLLKRNKLSLPDISHACLGIPCFGENPRADRLLTDQLYSFLSPVRPIICNDVELGFWGANPSGIGIHLVCGTGAIAYGRNSAGETKRSNGWHFQISDEGSGYWLGKIALSLYLKEADGREEPGILFTLVKEYLEENYQVNTPLEFIEYYDKNLADNRKEIAAFQKILSEAALAGDPAASDVYGLAAHELSISVIAIAKDLFPEQKNILVTYSGGIFNNGELILQPLRNELAAHSLSLHPPVSSPEDGGIYICLLQ